MEALTYYIPMYIHTYKHKYMHMYVYVRDYSGQFLIQSQDNALQRQGYRIA
jgi:hypothetical protein